MSALLKFGDYALAHSRLLAQLPDKVRERQIKRREQHQKLWNALLEDARKEGVLRADADIHLCRVFILGCINSVQTWFNPKARVARGGRRPGLRHLLRRREAGAGLGSKATKASSARHGDAFRRWHRTVEPPVPLATPCL